MKNRIYQNPQQWKNNDDLHRWISFGKFRANRFRCRYQKEWSRKHRNQNCTCSRKNGNHLSRRTRSNKNRTTYAKENINISTENLHIFVDSQATIQAIIEQNHQNYHEITIREIKQNLINISHSIKSVKFVNFPAHKGIVENETADKLEKIAAKKAQTLKPTYIVSSSEINTENKKMTLSKWQRRWINTKDN